MSSTVQKLAMIFGVVFIIVGLLGFYYTGMNMQAEPDKSHYLLGMFPVNALHNIVHVLFGVWGILAARSWNGAVTYAKTGGIIYILLAVLGFISPSAFGLIPIGGNDIWLHAVLGVVLAAVGFTARPEASSATATA